MFSEKKIFNISFSNLPFLSPLQPIKFSDFDKSHMKRRGLLNEHFCKYKFLIYPLRQKSFVNFHFSNYKSMENISCHSNQRSNPTGIKRNSIYVEANVLSMYAKF